MLRQPHRALTTSRARGRRAGLAAVLVASLLSGILAVVPAPISSATASRAEPSAPNGVPPRVRQVRLSGVDRSSLLGAASVRPANQREELAAGGIEAAGLDEQPEVLTPFLAKGEFDAIGLSWAPRRGGSSDPAVWVRVREAAGWSAWNLLPTLDVGPDADSSEGGRSGRVATEPLVTNGADAFQVRVDAGAPLGDVRADVINAGQAPSDEPEGTSPRQLSAMANSPAVGFAATSAPARPDIITRAQWGADESLRSGEVGYSSSIKVGVVHHTATSNGYTSANAYAQIRAIYAYHTLSLGWSDIAYNFLVDKDGRIFEGRYGGVDRPVIGAATGGFNRDTFSVSALGNFDEVGAPPAMVAAIARVMAWKYAIHYVNPLATSQLTSAGADTARYPAGQVVTVPNLIGHRDTNYTSCPGRYLYGELDAIRWQIQQLLPSGLEHPAVTTTFRTPTANGSVHVTSGMLYGGNWSVTFRRRDDGVLARTYVGTGWSIDLAWPMVDDAGTPVADGLYDVRIETEQNGSLAVPFTDTISTAGVFGNFEGLRVTPAGTVASGWASVTNGAPATVALVTDGVTIVRVPADQLRPDVGAAYPTLGANRGFSGLPAMGPGTHLVCAWGEGDGLKSSLLGCRWVDNLPDQPIGNVESSAALMGGLRITGWALDRHAADPITTRYYVDGQYAGDRSAAGLRSDVAASYPAYGPGHGFSVDLNAGPGRHQVCINGLNVGPGPPEVLLNCVTAATVSGSPIGNFEQMRVGSGSVTVRGWTFDPDSTSANSVHVYVDGAFSGAFTANGVRSDLSTWYPFMGTAHGFDATVGTSTAGRHTVCVYAINAGPPAPNPLLGCSAFG